MKPYLKVICGPMNSGKSRELIADIDRFRHMRGIDYLLVKPRLDTRSTKVKTRFGGLELDCLIVDEKSPEEILKILCTQQVVAIDEAQFFDKKLVGVIEKLLKNNKYLIVCGLDLDFRGEPFGPMPEILALANEVKKLTAVCQYSQEGVYCNQPATRTQRLINGEPADYNSPLVLVGDKDFYEARCINHHFVPGKKY